MRRPEQATTEQRGDAERLRRQWEAFKAAHPHVSQELFAKTAGIGTQGMFWQYLTAVSPLNLAAAIKFAAAFRCQLTDISPSLAALARAAIAYVDVTAAGDESERELLSLYRRLDERGRERLLKNVRRLTNEQAEFGLAAA